MIWAWRQNSLVAAYNTRPSRHQTVRAEREERAVEVWQHCISVNVRGC